MEFSKKISALRAFRSLNYSLYFIGRSVSQFGTWMQRTAVIWVIYTMTHSAFMLGVTIFAEQFPSFLLSVFGGIASDRYDRYKILRITQLTSMLQAVLLAVLIMTGHYAVWQILVLSVILGIINAFDVPARQALVNEVVYDESDLPAALSLNSAMASLAKLLGPVLSGIILEKFGAGVCFLLNAGSFAAVIVSLMLMKLPVYTPHVARKKVFSELAEGFIYLKKTPEIGIIILAVAIVSLLIMPYDTLLPVFAKVIFRGNAATFGYITSFVGVGAVAGTFYLASLRRETDLRKVLLIDLFILGAGLICFSQIASFPVAMAFAAIIGFGTVAQGTISNIIVQSESSARLRGRVISILLMAMFGMLPLGSLIIGTVSQWIGAPATILCQGILALITCAVFFKVMMKRKPAANGGSSPDEKG